MKYGLARLVFILVGLLIVKSALLGFMATPYLIAKLASTVVPVGRTVGQPLAAFAIFVGFREAIFLYFMPFLAILALGLRLAWLKIATVSYGIGLLSLLLPFFNVGNLGLILAIALMTLAIFSGSLIQLFWQRRLPRISSFSTVIFGLIYGVALGIFAIAAIFPLQTLSGLPWTTLLLPIFLLFLCLAFSLNQQLKTP